MSSRRDSNIVPYGKGVPCRIYRCPIWNNRLTTHRNIVYCPEGMHATISQQYRRLAGLSPEDRHILIRTYDELGIDNVEIRNLEEELPVGVCPLSNIRTCWENVNLSPLDDQKLEGTPYTLEEMTNKKIILAPTTIMEGLNFYLGIKEGDAVRIRPLVSRIPIKNDNESNL